MPVSVTENVFHVEPHVDTDGFHFVSSDPLVPGRRLDSVEEIEVGNLLATVSYRHVGSDSTWAETFHFRVRDGLIYVVVSGQVEVPVGPTETLDHAYVQRWLGIEVSA